jgi:hypothetical protein
VHNILALALASTSAAAATHTCAGRQATVNIAASVADAAFKEDAPPPKGLPPNRFSKMSNGLAPKPPPPPPMLSFSASSPYSSYS